MNEPVFLSLEQVFEIHKRGIERHGGTLGIRDRGGIEAAVDQPRNVFHYGNGDLFEIAAAYAFHIAESQCFLDGNKRTGITAALAFLRVNGVALRFDDMKLYDLMIGIAERRATKADLAAYFRDASRPGQA